jgi:hypothetical protein
VLPCWPIADVNNFSLLAFSNPSAGDVDSDGVDELCLNGDDRVTCFECDCSLVTGFPFDFEYGQENMSAVLIGNVYGSDRQLFFGAADKRIYGLQDDLSHILGFPIDMQTFVYGTPTITDIDGDDLADLVSSCLNGVYVIQLGGTYDTGTLDWPMYQHDIGRTGCTTTPLERPPKLAEGPESAAFRFAVHPNVPNPFRDGTDIKFVIPERTAVRLTAYDVSGRAVRRLLFGEFDMGAHVLRWDGRDDRGHRLPQGVYFIHVEAGRQSATRRAVILR